MTSEQFNEILWDYYSKNSRDSLTWRTPALEGGFDAYIILVSEIMLQQTQVTRVIPKYDQWLTMFPTIQTLASAPFTEVLGAWSGLGYNRRAKFLHDAAKQVASEHHGVLPKTQAELVKLPGIGIHTAGAICAYAYNQPVVFIETNIRTAFLYHFYPDRIDVTDTELIQLIKQTLDTENPREWYWALMDYGTYIKKTQGNYSRNSKHYVKQSNFIGSKRQIRGKVLEMLVQKQPLTRKEFSMLITDSRLDVVLENLVREAMIVQKRGRFYLND